MGMRQTSTSLPASGPCQASFSVHGIRLGIRTLAHWRGRRARRLRTFLRGIGVVLSDGTWDPGRDVRARASRPSESFKGRFGSGSGRGGLRLVVDDEAVVRAEQLHDVPGRARAERELVADQA